MSKTTLVTFTADVYPHVRGEVINIDNDELKRVDEVAKSREIESAYEAGEVELQTNEPSAEVVASNEQHAKNEAAAVEKAKATDNAQAKTDAKAEETK